MMTCFTTYLIVDQLENGRWVICWPDLSRFETEDYKTAGAAKRAITMLRKAGERLEAQRASV